MNKLEMKWKDIERLYSCISEIRNDNGCIEWISYVNNKGYGNFWCNYSVLYPHRLVKMFEDATWGETIHHKCHNKRCCNSDHLIWMTHAENCREELGSKCDVNHLGIPSLYKESEHKSGSRKGQKYFRCEMCLRRKIPSAKYDIGTFNRLSQKEGYYLIPPPL